LYNRNLIQNNLNYCKDLKINHSGYGTRNSIDKKTSKQKEIAAFNHIIGLPKKENIAGNSKENEKPDYNDDKDQLEERQEEEEEKLSKQETTNQVF
jgi:hypothetical protein